MICNNLFIFRIFAPQDGFVLFFHSGLKIINLVRTGYANTVLQSPNFKWRFYVASLVTVFPLDSQTFPRFT
jgi:hypothetical protein